jgi:hypothetical protein
MRASSLFAVACLASSVACTLGTPIKFAKGNEGEGEGASAGGEGEGQNAGGEGEGQNQGGEGEGQSAGEGEGAVGGEGEGAIDCSSTAGMDLYTRKIEPLVSGQVPTTCNQCHLQGVDLSMYVQNTSCGTMSCMLADGVVTFTPPESSPILTFILNSNPASNLITPQVIQEEHDGMLEWIDWSAQCQATACPPAPANPCGTGATQPPPPTVLSPINGCDPAGLVQLFDQKVFSWRGRCVSCHAAYGAGNTTSTPQGLPPTMFYGTQESPEGPNDAEFTMFNLIGRGEIDLSTPANSRLLHKPLNDLPASPHGGGTKFQNTSDQSYLDFLSWITAYDACMSGSASPPAPIGNPPTVGILSPTNGTTVPAGNVTFQCTASDVEDGIPASIVWTSDLDGNIGTGCGPFTKNITTPTTFRTITVTATDSDGNVAIDRIAFGLN